MIQKPVNVDAVDAWLPQTQCTKCGYPRCRAYAEALVHGQADINQCPPGGDSTIHGLATMFKLTPKPLNPLFGHHQRRQLAEIDENLCIGCTLCIQACPVDAIIGAAKQMHTVIVEECTGCELCVSPCPVDCIDLKPDLPEKADINWRWPDYPPGDVERARRRAEIRLRRIAMRISERDARRRNRAMRLDQRRRQMKKDIQEAVARVRAKRSHSKFNTQ